MTQKQSEAGKIREAVGVFGSSNDLNKAVAELEATAFPRDALSILGTTEALKEKFGDTEIFPEVVEDNPNTPRNSPVHPEERALGAAALVGGGAYLGAVSAAIAAGAISVPALITAAAIGGGVGGIIAKIMGSQHTEHIKKQLEKGGLLLWVHTNTPQDETIACDILKKHNAQHVHVHEIS